MDTVYSLVTRPPILRDAFMKALPGKIAHVKSIMGTAEFKARRSATLMVQLEKQNRVLNFRNPYKLIFEIAGFRTIAVGDIVDDYEIIFDLLMHEPDEEEVNKLLTLCSKKMVPAIFQSGLMDPKKFKHLATSVLMEENPTLNRLFSLCNDDIQLTLLTAFFILNAGARVNAMTFIARRYNCPTLIMALNYLYPLSIFNNQ